MIVGSITVRKILSISSVHNRISATVTFVTATVHSESHGQQPQRINLVTGFQIAILEIPFRLGATFRFQIFFILFIRFVVFAITVGIAARAIIIIVVIVGRNSQFTLFHHCVSAGTYSVIISISSESSRVSFKSGTYCDNIQNTSDTFRIIFSSW